MTTAQSTVRRVRAHAPSAGEPSSRARGVRLGALFGPSVFGVTAAAVALPRVVDDLNAAPTAGSWVLIAHALALGVGTALAGRLADAWGVRAMLTAGAGVLVVGMVICLVAPTLPLLVAGRVIQAAGSGAMVAGALTLSASTGTSQRPGVLSWFGATIAAFASGATLAGGLVTDALSWRFTLVLPALSLAAIPTTVALIDGRRPARGRVDMVGAGLLAATAGSLLVLVQARALHLSPAPLLALALTALIGVAVLTRHIRRVPGGFVPRRLATDRKYLAASAIGVGIYGAFFAAVYAVPQLLSNEHGWGVVVIGASLLPGAVAGAAVSRATSRLAESIDPQRLLAGTATLFAVLLGLAALSRGLPVVLLAATSLGFASFAVTQVVLTSHVSAAVEAGQRGAAIGLLNLGFFVGGAFGSAIAGALAEPIGLTGALAVVAVLPLGAAIVALRLRPPTREQ